MDDAAARSKNDEESEVSRVRLWREMSHVIGRYHVDINFEMKTDAFFSQDAV